MYNNAGKSIKGLVKIVVGIQMVLFIILGIVLMVVGEDAAGAFLGFLVGGAGCFFAWLSGLILYAYGEIADGIQRLAGPAKGDTQTVNGNAERESGNITKYQKNVLRVYQSQLENGVITKEQYEEKKAKLLSEE